MKTNQTLEKIQAGPIEVKKPALTVMSPMALADVFLASGFFKDTTSQAQATVKILMGQELGMTPMASMMGIHIVQGKPMLSYTTVAALIDRHPRYDYKCKVRDSKRCEIQFYKDGEASGPPVVFTIEDAKLAGTQNLAKIPSTMLFARALTQGARAYCAEVFGGCPIYDEGEIPDEVQGRPSTGKGVAALVGSLGPVDGEFIEPVADPETGEILDTESVSTLTTDQLAAQEALQL